MARALEAVRVTRLGGGATVAGRPVAAGDVVKLSWDAAEALVRAGRGEWTYRVKIGSRGLLLGNIFHGAHAEVSLPKRKALEIHRNRAGELLDPDQFEESELRRPADGVAPDPWVGELKIQVQVVGKTFFHANSTHQKGDVVELPEPVACRGIHAKVLKLAKTAALSRGGADYLASLGVRRGWF
jgi:hypothetical protein